MFFILKHAKLKLKIIMTLLSGIVIVWFFNQNIYFFNECMQKSVFMPQKNYFMIKLNLSGCRPEPSIASQ